MLVERGNVLKIMLTQLLSLVEETRINIQDVETVVRTSTPTDRNI